jgi:hypothetical protein
MIVMMDMSSGSRLDDEESLPFVHVRLGTDPVAQPTPQLGDQVGVPRLGLQLAVPDPAPRCVLRAPPLVAATWLMPISEETWYRH